MQLVPMIGGALGSKALASLFGGNQLAGNIGWFLGQAALSMLMPGQKVTNEGSRLSNLSVQSSAYGVPITIAFGKIKLAGNVIWARPLHEVRSESTDSSGKGSAEVTQTNITYQYFGRFAVALCEGPIEMVFRIWANSELIFDAGKYLPTGVVTPLNLNGAMPDDGVEIAPGIRLFFGTETQLPSSYIESFEGVGEVPAHRGLAYVVFEDWALEKFGNTVPALEFEISNYVSVEVPETTAAELPTAPSGVAPVPANAYWSSDYDETTGILAMRVYGAQGLLAGSSQLSGQPLYIQRNTAQGLVFDVLPLPDLSGTAVVPRMTTVGGDAYLAFSSSAADASPPYLRVALSAEGYHQITSARLPSGLAIGPLLTFDNGGLPEALRGGNPHANQMSPGASASFNVVGNSPAVAGQVFDYVQAQSEIWSGTWPNNTYTSVEGPTLMKQDGSERHGFSNLVALRPVSWLSNGSAAGGWVACDMGYVLQAKDELGLELVSVWSGVLSRFDEAGVLVSSQQFDEPAVAIPQVVFIDPRRNMLVFPGAVIQFWEL